MCCMSVLLMYCMSEVNPHPLQPPPSLSHPTHPYPHPSPLHPPHAFPPPSITPQTAIGHWCEVMFPLYSILKQESSFARPAHQFLLLHLKRVHLMEWVRAVIATTLGVPPDGDLPPLIMQREVDSVWAQIRMCGCCGRFYVGVFICFCVCVCVL